MSKPAVKREGMVSIHWFRKGLRLHDSPAMLEACRRSNNVLPVFVIDPHFAKPSYVGINRYAFLLQCLDDLDTRLRSMGSRLFVLRGKPEESILDFAKENGVDLVTFEKDTEPYAQKRDMAIQEQLKAEGIEVCAMCSHTLFDPPNYLAKNKGAIPTTYGAFGKLFGTMGKVRQPVESISVENIKPIPATPALTSHEYNVPTLEEMGYEGSVSNKFPGGETEALRRLEATITSRPQWVAKFEKPMTAPNSLEPSTTVLSPYLKFGCLSVATMYHEVARINSENKGHTMPPVSLHGQLLWREFFYAYSYATPNYDKMVGNPTVKQIPWRNDPELVEAWKEARTGFPWIDAIMTQLREEGWIHHLARHSVACFLTRGDLWQNWEEGAKVFDLYLLDADWAINNANWQWLSCSNFFYQYFRCYSPVAFGKKTDKNGEYIKKYLPQLRKFPAKYIYEPWTAPLNIQQSCGCIIGKDYPMPMVDHTAVSKENMNRIAAAYKNQPPKGSFTIPPAASAPVASNTGKGSAGSSPGGAAGGGGKSGGSAKGSVNVKAEKKAKSVPKLSPKKRNRKVASDSDSDDVDESEDEESPRSVAKKKPSQASMDAFVVKKEPKTKSK